MATPNTTTPANLRDEWRTPPCLLNLIRARFGPIEFDLAATAHNTVAPEWYDKEIDALTQPWHILSAPYLFVNMPFSNANAWFEKIHEEVKQGATIVAISLAPSGTKRDRYLNYADEIILFNRRIAFLDPSGTPHKGNDRGTMISMWRPDQSRYHQYPILTINANAWFEKIHEGDGR